jgi:hypothetical protein
MARSKRLADKGRFWRSMVEQQRQGGLTVREFCRERGISEPSFYAWRKELQRRDDAQQSAGGQRSGAGNASGSGRVAARESRGRLIPVEIVGSRCEGEGAPEGHQTNRPLEIGTPGGFTLRFDQDTRPETVLCLLEVIGRCTREGAASC